LNKNNFALIIPIGHCSRAIVSDWSLSTHEVDIPIPCRDIPFCDLQDHRIAQGLPFRERAIALNHNAGPAAVVNQLLRILKRVQFNLRTERKKMPDEYR
jgi:hypothetical protein